MSKPVITAAIKIVESAPNALNELPKKDIIKAINEANVIRSFMLDKGLSEVGEIKINEYVAYKRGISKKVLVALREATEEEKLAMGVDNIRALF